MSRQAGMGEVAMCCLNPPQNWSLLVISSLQTCSVTVTEDGECTRRSGGVCGKPGALSWLYVVEQVFFLEVNSPLGKLQPASLLGQEPSQKMSERRNLGSCKSKWVPAHSQSPSLCVIAIPHWSRLLYSLLRNLTSGTSMEIVLPFLIFFLFFATLTGH